MSTPALTLAAMLLLAESLAAADSAIVRGRVVDAAGGPLVGASVTIRRLEDGRFERTSKIGERGDYELKELPEGVYGIEAKFPGFVLKSVHHLVLRTAAQIRCDLQLDVAYLGTEGGMTYEPPRTNSLLAQDVFKNWDISQAQFYLVGPLAAPTRWWFTPRY